MLILFALVVRARDGLPLSASTDFQHNPELQERKQQLRTVSKVLGQFPDRAVVKGHDLNIYFMSSEGVSYMSVCDASLPAATAFCFLEDLRWDFTARIDMVKVTLAARPYPFLEFGAQPTFQPNFYALPPLASQLTPKRPLTPTEQLTPLNPVKCW
ncbi:hypothetical protein DPEC_G00080610 [Dallia pectoralis]|uniref:Uncharacterized protein n=1 Tax=Dallia pectoralis TaxID=75939 RepID=A0ACC2H4P7_DALPE|nr:hypothetical protein DPEC_G00080610 [Dallia pectoralis]